MLKKTIVVTFFLLMASALGFISQIVFFREFGASIEMDLYFSLLSVPTIITGVSPVVIASIVIPYFSQCRIEGESTVKRSYSIYLIILVFSFVFSILGGMLTHCNLNYTNITLPNSQVTLLITLLWAASGFSIISSYLAALLNYKDKFLLVACSSILPPLLMIISVLVMGKDLGVIKIFIGFFVAYLLQLVIFFYKASEYFDKTKFINKNYKFSFALTPRILITILSLLPFSAIPPLSYYLANFLPEGSVSILGYSQSFAGFLSVTTSMGAAIVGFPGLANAHVKGDKNSEYKIFEKTIFYVLFMAIFIGGAIASLSPLIVDVVYHSKSIEAKNKVVFANLIPLYILSATFISGINLLRSFAYSRNEQKLLAIIGSVTILLFVAFAVALSNRYSVKGVAIANTLSFGFFFFSLVLLYKIKVPNLMGNLFFTSLLKTVCAAMILYFSIDYILINYNFYGFEILAMLALVFGYVLIFYLLCRFVFVIEEVLIIDRILMSKLFWIKE